MKVKKAMLSRDKPTGVEVREQYIDIRRRRNPRRNVADLEREQQANIEDARIKIQQSKKNREEADAAEAALVVEDSPVEAANIEVADSSPAVIKASDIADTPKETVKPIPKKKIVKKTD